MRKTILLAVGLAMFLLIPGALAAVDGAFVNKSGATWGFVSNVYYSEGDKSYLDAVSGNQDLGIAACGIADSTKYGTVAYAANVSGTWTYVAVGYESGGTARSYEIMDNDISSICTTGYAGLPANFGVASSTHTEGTYNPLVYIAAFPGNPFLLVKSSNSGAPDAVYQFNLNRGTLLGTFTGVTPVYNQITHNVSVDFSNIQFTKSDATTLTKAKNDADHGITDSRRMVIAACTDQYGNNCADARVINSTGQFPVQLQSGINSPSDSATYTRYAVLNGIGTSYCIGPELQAYSVDISPANPYYSQAGAVNITVVTNNNGNVNVTTPFNVSVWEDGLGNIFIQNITINSLLNASANTTVLTNVNLSNKSSGSHTINVKVEDGASGIADCDSHANDQASKGFSILKTYNIETYINGTAGINFPQVGRPYNLSVHATDSDGVDVVNGTIKVIEKNGVSLIPMQYWNEGGQNISVIPYSIAQVMLNSTGWREFAIIPTGNKMIADEPNIANYYTGNYSLYVELYTSDGTFRIAKNMTVGSLTPDDPTEQVNVKNLSVINSAYDLVYRIYVTVVKWLNY